MMLLTKDILRRLPPLYATEKLKATETPVPLKLFSLSGRGTWYITEYDPESGRAFGWVKSPLGSDCDELGYIDINELKALKIPLRVRVGNRVATIGTVNIERDKFWNGKTTLEQVMKGEKG